MIKQLDCRKQRNKTTLACRFKRYCKSESFPSTVGKSMLSVIIPTAGAVIMAHDIGKSFVCSLHEEVKTK